MKWKDLLAEWSGEPLTCDAADTVVRDIVYDSRRAAADCVFVCIRGMSTDGHVFAPDAYNKGCRLFVVERALDLPGDAAQYRTDDSRAALASLSAAFFGHADRALCLVGVTGTKGKTTVASLAAQLLTAAGVETGYIGSNGIIYKDVHEPTANTTPESYELHRVFRRMVDAGVRAVVLEVSSQALFLGRVRGLTFPVTVFTNLAPDHIGPKEHPTFEHYRKCKASLFSEYQTETIVYNADDVSWKDMLAETACAKRISISLQHKEAQLYADQIAAAQAASAPGVHFDLTVLGHTQSVFLSMPGAFNVSNALAALAVMGEVCSRLTDLTPACVLSSAVQTLATAHVTGRLEAVPLYPDRVFVIDYAHNGYSLTSVLQVLRAYQPKRLICLFGSVGGRTKGRRAELGRAAAEAADRLIITSDNPDREDPQAIMEEISLAAPHSEKVLIADRGEAIAYAVRMSAPGDIVLLAGKGHERYQLIDGVKHPFCERDLLLSAAKLPV